MSLLKLNGYAVPCVAIDENHEQVGYGMARAYDGGALRDTRASKRKWTFRSKPLKEQDALALIGLVQGRGHKFGWSSFYSDSGLPAAASVATQHAVAADGAAVYDDYGALMYAGFTGSKYAVAVEAAATNLIYTTITTPSATSGQNIATGTDTLSSTSGFTAVAGGVITSDTTHYWQGSRSLKMVAAAVGDGVITGWATCSADSNICCSAYVKVSGAQVTFAVYQDSGAPTLLVSQSVTDTGGAWQRVELPTTLSGGNTTAAIRIEAASGASTVYCDGFQIEENNWVTSWVAGTRATGSLQYTAKAFAGWRDLTVNMWATSTGLASSDDQVLCRLGVSTTDYIEVYRDGLQSNRITVVAYGTGDLITTDSKWAAGSWLMVTLGVRFNAESGEYGVELYTNGVSRGTATLSGYTGLTSAATLAIGNDGTPARHFHMGRIDSTLVVPYRASATEIAAWYGNFPGAHSVPSLVATGDFVTDSSVTVVGEVTHVMNVPHYATAWRGNGRVVEFALEEI